ncbi:hypothetical protein D9M68_442770 [compost metagenome]
MFRVQGEDATHLPRGPHHIAPAQVGLAQAQHVLDVALLLDHMQAVQRTLVVLLDAQHPFVVQPRGGKVALGAGQVAIAQQRLHRPGALGGHGHLRANVVGRFAGGLFQLGQARFELAGVDQVQPFALGRAGGAAGQQHQRQVPRQAIHSALPTVRVWAMSRGR